MAHNVHKTLNKKDTVLLFIMGMEDKEILENDFFIYSDLIFTRKSFC